MDDTGCNVAETTETLLLQQQHLLQGRRSAQMFPKGTAELPLPEGFIRTETARGIFHHTKELASQDVQRISSMLRENEILGLGPYNKVDVLTRGEPLIALVERSVDGVEIRAALGVFSTLPEQIQFFVDTATPGATIGVEVPTDLIKKRAP